MRVSGWNEIKMGRNDDDTSADEDERKEVSESVREREEGKIEREYDHHVQYQCYTVKLTALE